MWVLQELNGPAFGALFRTIIKNQPQCGPYGMSLGSGGALVAIVNTTPKTTERFIGQWAFSSATPSMQLLSGPPFEPNILVAAGDNRTFLFLKSSDFALYDTQAKAFTTKAGVLATVPILTPVGVPGGGIGQNVVIGQGITYTDNAGNWQMVTAPGKFITGFSIDRRNQNRMYWVESVDYAPSTASTLYTAPLSRSPAELAANGGPVKVTSIGASNGRGGAGMFANAGLVLDFESWSEALAIRGSDGKGWKIPAEPGTYFVEALWADDKELWFSTGVVAGDDTPDCSLFLDGIMVIDRQSKQGNKR
jgi:hypothetical protein